MLSTARWWRSGLVWALAGLAPWLAAQGAPYTPTQDSQVLETLAWRAADRPARELAALRAALAKASPQARPGATAELAQRYFELALARGDPRFVGYAQALVDGFAAPLPAPLLVVRGTLRQYRHDFAGALADFAAALVLEPDMAQAHAWRAAIYLVQANYAQAAPECAALARLQRPVLWGGCQGLLLAYSGQLALAQTHLAQALQATKVPEQRLWLLTRLGEVAAWRGQAAEAQAHYRAALALGHEDAYLLAAWSDFLLDAGRPAEVLPLLARWEASDPLLLRLALAEAALKRPAAQAHAKLLDDRFAAARLRGDSTHLAEEARHQLQLRGNAPEALRLATLNYQAQREPRDALIVLQAAQAAGQPAAAQPVLAWLHRSGFEGLQLRQLGAAWAPAVGR